MKTSIFRTMRHSLMGLVSLFAASAAFGTPPSPMVSPTVKLLDESGTSTVSGASAAVYMKTGGYYYSKGTTTNGALVVGGLTSGSTYEFYVDYNHGRKYFTIVAGTDSAFVQTTKVSVNLKNCNGIIGSGSNASVAIKGNIDGYYWNMGSTSSGVLNLYLLPTTYSVQMDYNHGRNVNSVSVSGNTQDVDFTATCVKVRVNNCNGVVTSGSNASVAIQGNIDGYYWSMGSTSAGELALNLLGGVTYDFQMDYNHGRNNQSASISGSSQIVDFTATCVKVTVSNCSGVITGAANPLSNISQSSPASFSLRRISASYSGKAINVRRSSDNTTQDIGFTTNGDLDTSALKSFVGSGSGYVTKWYDQSGNSRDAYQSNSSYQPRIVNSGVVERQNNQPAIRFLGMYYGLHTDNFTAYSSGVSYNGVAKVNSNLTYNAIVNKTGATYKNVPAPLDFYNARFVVGTGSSYTFIDHSNSFNASKPLGIWTYQGTPGGNLNTFYNGAVNGSSSIGSSYSDAGQPLYIGSRADVVTGLDGWISEIVTYGAELSSTDRQVLEGSQAQYYSVSGPTPSSTTNATGSVSIKGNIDGYYWNMGSTNSGTGTLDLNLLPGSYSFQMDYNHGRNTQSASISGSSQTVDFATTCVSVNINNCNGVVTTGANASVAIKGNIDGYYWNMGSTTNGTLKLNLLPNTYDFQMDYNHGRNNQSVAITGSSQAVDFTATCVSVRVLDYNGNVINTNGASVAVKGNIDGYYWNFGSTTSGVVSINLLPNTYSFQMDYNHGRNIASASISGGSQNVDFSTTRTSVKLADCNHTAISGAAGNVSIKGNIDGYYWNMGNTTNGVLDLDLLPNSYDFSVNYNHFNNKTGSTSVSGTTQTVEFTTTLLTITGSGISFKGNIDGYFWSFTNNSYMLPGAYVFKIGGIEYNLNVTGCSMSQKAVVVKLLNSSGAGISGGVVDYYVNSWVNNQGTTDNNGNVLLLFPSSVNNAYFRMNYAAASQQLGSYNINTTTTVTFQTKKVTVELKNSSGGYYNNEGTNVGYYASNWNTFGTGTTSSGKCQMELLPVNYYFHLTYSNQQQQLGSLNLASMGAAPVILFQTVDVTLRLKDAAGTGTHEATSLGYYTNNWYQFAGGATTGSGTAHMELLPGNYYFRMSYSNQSQQKGSMYISTSGNVDFQTVNVTLKLKDAAGTGTHEATSLGYYTSNWYTFGSGVTNGSGTETMELLPGNYYFRLSYANQSQQLGSMNISASTCVPFQTVSVTMVLKDASGVTGSIEGDALGYYTSSWYPFGDNTPGVTSGGTETMELLPGNYYFRMSYAHQSQQQGSMNISAATNVNFQTVNVTQHLTDGSSNIYGGTAEYYTNTWYSFGTTDVNGDAVKELLPGTYYFRMTYGSYTKQKGSYAINAASTVNYTYTSGSGISRVAISTAKNPNTNDKDNTVADNETPVSTGIGSNINPTPVVIDAPVVTGFKAYPNPFTEATNISYQLGSSQHVQVEVYNASGAMVKLLLNDVQTEGNHTVVLSASDLAGGIYYVRVVTAEGMKQIPVMVHK